MLKRRLLIVGCGDVAQRALPWLVQRFQVFALCRTTHQASQLRQQGVTPMLGDLDKPETLKRLVGIAQHVLYSAPPAPQSGDDMRTKWLISYLLRGGMLARSLCYISTTGVYGDCSGAAIDETRPCHPESARAHRRQRAEQLLRQFGKSRSVRVSLLRAPGIYANNRLPIDRLMAALPALTEDQDGYSNHIHADDLAKACCLALFRGKSGRAYNVCDDSEWKMGEWFDKVADAHGLKRPIRLDREAIQLAVSPAIWSFIRESRRIKNKRLKGELRLSLAYPTPQTLLDHLRSN